LETHCLVLTLYAAGAQKLLYLDSTISIKEDIVAGSPTNDFSD